MRLVGGAAIVAISGVNFVQSVQERHWYLAMGAFSSAMIFIICLGVYLGLDLYRDYNKEKK